MREKNREIKKEDDLGQRIIDVARVTRVMAGGKRMKFRVCLAVGDKKGRVGFGIAKGSDVTGGISKALDRAKKNMIKVPMQNETILHPIDIKFNSAKVLLKPAKKGSGIKAGGPVRTMCELAGIPNVTGKILGSNNKINIVKATMEAFKSFKITKNYKDEKKVEDKPKENESQQKTVKEKQTIKDKFKKLITKKD